MSKNEEEAKIEEDKFKNPRFRRILIVIFAPLIFAVLLFLHRILPIEPKKQVQVGYTLGWTYVFCVVGVLWMTHALSMPLTGLIPFVAFPLLGTVHAKTLSNAFMSDSNMANFGIIVLMMAFDNTGLRKRITMRILTSTSGSVRLIYIYTFSLTLLLSMWLNSTGATYLMMKVVDDILLALKEEAPTGALGEERMAVLQSIVGKNEPKVEDEKTSAVAMVEKESTGFQNETSSEEGKVEVVDVKEPLLQRRNVEEEMKAYESENEQLLQDFGAELLYAIAVAANIGGTLWPYGSTVGVEIYKLKYVIPTDASNSTRYGFTEASWMMYSLPLLLINSFMSLTFLMWAHFSSSSFARRIVGGNGNRLCNFMQCEESLDKMSTSFTEKRGQLGPWTFKEKGVVFLTMLLILLLLTSLPLFMLGWSSFLPSSVKTDVGDSVVYVSILILLFLIPKSGIGICSGPKSPTDKPKPEGICGWKYLQSKFPWSILVLTGASRAIGKYSDKTVGAPVALFIYERFLSGANNPNIMLLKLIMMSLIVFSSTFVSNTGAVVGALKFWSAISTNLYKKKGVLLGGEAVLPALSIAHLCFMLPNSSIPTAMVFRYKEKKNLSACYFLRLGTPLFFCTITVTITYALLWAPKCLMLA